MRAFCIADEIWNMLNILGYRVEELKKLVTQELVKQLYIDSEAVADSDPPKLIFKWGERATLEFSKVEILQFAAEVRIIP